MKQKLVITFVFFFPAALVLVHDFVLFAVAFEKGFMLTSVGWLWDHYHKTSHDQWPVFLRNNELEHWKSTLINILKLKAVFLFTGIGILVSALFWGIVMLLETFHLGTAPKIKKRKKS